MRGQKLTYLVSTSVDGFIAGPEGSLEGFLAEGPHLSALAEAYPEMFPTHLRAAMNIDSENVHFDSVLMGRLTYEVGLRFGIASPYGHLNQYAFSRSMRESPSAEVELVSSDPAEFVKQLKAKPGRGIWLCGGGALASSLVELIDELVLKVNPFLLGSGIKLFAEPIACRPLRVVSRQTYENGVMVVRYACGRAATSG